MIIITGMDNTGKTTLVENLVELTYLQKVNSPGPIGEVGQRDWFLSQVVKGTHNNIYERFPLIEEVVYGETLRDKGNFQYGDYYFQYLQKLDPLIIYTRPPAENIFNFGDREQMPGVIEQKEKLLAAYDDLMFRMLGDGWRILPYSYKVDSPEWIYKIILEGGIING